MATLLLIVLIGIILYFAYWRKYADVSWQDQGKAIQKYVNSNKKRASKITTLIYRKYKVKDPYGDR